MKERVFDAVIVGSGASGGWVAKQLTEAGLRVAVLEAGRKLDPAVDFTEHKLAHEMPLRGQRQPPKAARREQEIQRLCYQCDEYAHHLFVKDTELPYTTAQGKPFAWIRGRHVGGKSVTWARQSYRLSDHDLKAASRDGFGVDWPVSYAELAPYYDRVESFIGVSGQAERLPQLPDGRFLPPMELTCGERLLKTAIEGKLGRTLTIGRTAILTRPLHGRPACHYCGPCSRGCSTGSYYSSPASTLPAAERTGRLTLIPDAVVSHIEVDDAGRCRSVAYIDRITRAPREAFGKMVVLCASALESTRIMLSSRSPGRHPRGIANSSGVLGHFLMDHVMGGGARGTLPVLKGVPDTRPNRPNGIYIPRFRNVDDRHPEFLRGYGYQGSAHEEKWGHAFKLPGFGASFKERVRERPWSISLGGFGECLPRYENYCELDPDRVDAWGIPVLRFSVAFGDNERKMVKDMADCAEEMLKAAGAEDIERREEISLPGLAIHEVGTARMGDDPKTSVVNRWQQAHDVPNLFVMDGSVYPSSACQNPTLTIMALASRACDYLAEQYRRGAL